MDSSQDVIIVGGGPAGLSAALMLGRCRRRVLVFDSGKYRNYATHAMHGFITRDGTDPAEIRRIAREELKRYGVDIVCSTVQSARKDGERFVVETLDYGTHECRKLVLATGVMDELPAIDRIEEFYGRSIHHCPYCDGWEHRDQPMAVYGKGTRGIGLAMSMKTWSPDITLVTDGDTSIPAAGLRKLNRLGIHVRTEKIATLEGKEGDLERVHFETGGPIECRAIFFNTGQRQSCGIAGGFECIMTDKGTVKTDRWERTSVPGLYAVGDCSRNVQWVVVAAAQGAIAAEAINIELQEADRRAYLAARGQR